MPNSSLTSRIKAYATGEVGFDLVGISPAELPSHHGGQLRSWIAKGYAGTMEYMRRDPERRADPKKVLPSARSVISLALNYHHPEDARPAGDTQGKIAKYAYGADYHKIIEKMLKNLAAFVQAEGGEGTEVKTYVDTGPILERAFAQQAGLGFVGKNTNVISKEFGSWIFLACLITNLELELDKPHTGSCGSCRICIDACPTGALLGQYTLDATRCISYWTIEAKEKPSPELRAKFGDWVFGCDICQDVCPYNFRAKTTAHAELYPNRVAGTWVDRNAPAPQAGSPLKRAKLLKT